MPPGIGIVHQVNLEQIATVVTEKKLDGKSLLYFDTLVGTDSHTTMINGLGVLGWGVGGIEAGKLRRRHVQILAPNRYTSAHCRTSP